MIDLTGSLIIELRDDAGVGSWAGDRIRGERPAPGDAQGHGAYNRFVRVQRVQGPPREFRAPVQYPRFAISTYGLTDQDAMAGYGLASDALQRGARVRANGHPIYISFEEASGDPASDPDTKQPFVTFIVQLIAGSAAIV